MSDTKKYFHDRFVLLMLSINIFLTFACVALVLLRLGDTSNSYIAAYRSNLGLNAYSVGNVGQLLSFAAFAVFIGAGQIYLSLKLYAVRKQAAWILMIMAALLLTLAIVISNSLLQLR